VGDLPLKQKPHFKFRYGAWLCGMPNRDTPIDSILGIGRTPLEAWLSMWMWRAASL
jgi:hypothetical protein